MASHLASQSQNQTPEKKITLKSSDGNSFIVEEAVAMEMATVKGYLEDKYGDNIADTENANITLPLHNVSSASLAKIVAYCKKRVELRRNNSSDSEAEIRGFADRLLKDEDVQSLMQHILAANYLEVKELFEMVAQKIADKIQNKSVEHVRALFQIKNDFTPEEEEELRKETAWAFEGVDKD